MARTFVNANADYIDCSNASVLNPTGAMSFGVWVNLSTLVATPNFQRWIFARDDNTLGRSFAFGVQGSVGAVGLVLQIGGATTAAAGTSSYPGASQWVHAGFSGTGTSWTVYQNGISVATGTSSAPSTTTASTTIGERTYSGFTDPIDGTLADACFWGGVALNVGEFLSLTGGQRPSTIRQKSIIGYWPLDGLQSPEPDLSGNKNNGTLHGTSKGTSGPPVTMLTPRPPSIPMIGVPPTFISAWALGRNSLNGAGIAT